MESNPLFATEEAFKNYVDFIDREYPKIKDKNEFDGLYDDVIFCNGRIQDFYGLLLIRFLMHITVLNEELPKEFKEWDKKEKERFAKINWEDEAQSAAELDNLLKIQDDMPDMTNVKFHYSIKENFNIDTIKTIEYCKVFWEQYNLDLEYWSK